MSLKNKIEKIIQAINNTDINQIEITSFWGFQKIKLSKDAIENIKSKSIDKKTINEDENVILDSKIEVHDPVANEVINEEIKEVVDTQEYTVIKAPLVGTFYLSPKPDEPPFINIGDIIKKGQIFCIIEAMKIFNEIESDSSGKVIDILIDNGTPVEYDQDLIVLSIE